MKSVLRLETPAAVADHVRDSSPAVLDVRDERAFAAGHLAGSGHVETASIRSRAHELPHPRTSPLLVVASDPAAIETAARALAEEGFTDVAAATYADARDAGLPIEEGSRAARLWRPQRIVEEAAPFLRPLRPGPVLDVACGNGRNAVFLALEGFDVVACDVLESALERTRALARGSGTTVGTWLVDLERTPRPLPVSAYAAVAVLNYLHRPLVPDLRAAVRPGGIVVYETFTVDQPRLFGKPRRPRFLLGKGELETAFEGFEILLSREGIDAPGRAVASLVARRPACLAEGLPPGAGGSP